MIRRPPRSTLFPYTNALPISPALWDAISNDAKWQIFALIGFLEFWSELSTPNHKHYMRGGKPGDYPDFVSGKDGIPHPVPFNLYDPFKFSKNMSEIGRAHAELQSHSDLVCRLLLEKKKNNNNKKN